MKTAKREYGDKVVFQMQDRDPRRMWQNISTITDYKRKSNITTVSDPKMADDINTFFARHEDSVHPADINSMMDVIAPIVELAAEGEVPTLSEHDVRLALKNVNSRKAAGPDNILGRVIKVCADQIAPIVTCIYNASLRKGVVPMLWKESIIIPIAKNNKPSCMNDFRPVALTAILSFFKFFFPAFAVFSLLIEGW